MLTWTRIGQFGARSMRFPSLSIYTDEVMRVSQTGREVTQN